MYAIFLSAFGLFAHGDLSLRITEKTKEIAKSPSDSELYLERGFLYQQHLDFNEALDDYLNAKKLGLNSKLLQFRITETLYSNQNYHEALLASNSCLEFDSHDVKSQKLHAKILIELNQLNQALESYQFVVENTEDIRPEDIIDYANLIITINPVNYSGAIDALDSGLEKIGYDTFSLQLKKLEYYQAAGLTEESLNQHNYFILTNNRKEFWYYKKAKYLTEIYKNNDALVAIKQSQLAIQQLDIRFQDMKSIKDLITKLDILENQLSNEK